MEYFSVLKSSVIIVFSSIAFSSSFWFGKLSFIKSLCIFSHGVLCCFLITSLGALSPINLGVFFRFVFFSVPYLSFCLRLWNLAFVIIDPVIFLFDLLCLQFFWCFRLRNFACEILGLVLFLFNLLCVISLCCFRLRNLACETLGLVLFLFHLLCSQLLHFGSQTLVELHAK